MQELRSKWKISWRLLILYFAVGAIWEFKEPMQCSQRVGNKAHGVVALTKTPLCLSRTLHSVYHITSLKYCSHTEVFEPNHTHLANPNHARTLLAVISIGQARASFNGVSQNQNQSNYFGQSRKPKPIKTRINYT